MGKLVLFLSLQVGLSAFAAGLTGLQWKGSCETKDPESSSKCDWTFGEDKTGKVHCDHFSNSYCTGDKHYMTDESFKYEPAKKKDVFNLTFAEGSVSKKVVKFIVEGSMLSVTPIEETSRKSGLTKKFKPAVVTYTGY